MMSLYWVCTSEKCFKRDYVKEAIEKASDKTGGSPEYGISDGAHNAGARLSCIFVNGSREVQKMLGCLDSRMTTIEGSLFFSPSV